MRKTFIIELISYIAKLWLTFPTVLKIVVVFFSVSDVLCAISDAAIGVVVLHTFPTLRNDRPAEKRPCLISYGS